MLTQKAGAAVQPTAPNDKNSSDNDFTKRRAIQSNESLKDQIGLLLWQLQSPLGRRQHRVGWRLFKVLLMQYLTIRGEMQ